MDDMEIRMFVKDRDKTFTNAVLYDDWDGVRAYCKRYGMKLPRNESVMKGRNLQGRSRMCEYSYRCKDACGRKVYYAWI